MQYIYILFLVILAVILWQLSKQIKKGIAEGEKVLTEDDIKIFHIFPDYPKSYPCECKAGEELHFKIKGYTDKYLLEEVPIDGNEIKWKHTESNGEFKGNRHLKTGEYTGQEIDFITPKIDVYKKEKMIFVSAHYKGFTDATWIKIVN